jgi:cytochrome c oxidase assembly factor CtaG
MSGLLVLWIVVASPLSALDHHLLTIHMINHLLLMTVAAPLLLAGSPAAAISQALPTNFSHRANEVVSSSSVAQALASLLKHPVFCWLFATATVIGWHLPAVFQIAMHSHPWHEAEYLSFLLAGLLFWQPVAHPGSSATTPEWPRWSIPLYLFLATLPCDILSAFLVFCGRVVYPSYLSAPGLFHLSALQDQQCAGALMWVAVTFAYLLPAAVITIQILSPAHAHSQQSEHALSNRPMEIRGNSLTTES